MLEFKTVLVVEDNELNREILSAILEDTYHVLTAENGAEGLEVLRKMGKGISLILLDIQMPVMNGYEFLKTIGEDGRYTDIPIIVTTSGNTDEEQIRCLEMGASDFVVKPYNPEIVKKRTESLIRLRETSVLLHKVERDSLSGAYNRESFMEYVSQRLKENPNTEYDIVCLEIESYRLLHGRYGNDKCNELVRTMVRQITQSMTDDVILGRIENEQLAFLMKQRSMEEHARLLNEFMNIRSEVSIPNVEIKCGVYKNVDHSLPVSAIISDVQMAVDGIRNQYDCHLTEFDDSIRKKVYRQQMLNNHAHEALREKQMLMYYQPKYNTEENAVGGAEALVRWIHPELGFISPGDFIPLFESNGLIYEVDKYTLEAVCADIRRWLDEGKKVVPVSVNVSQVDFDRPELADIFEEIVDRYNIPHELIHFEITESMNATDKNKKAQAVSEFKEKGFEVELDDFGAGYSNLSTLGDLMIDIVKIDISLVRNMFNPKHRAILNSVIYAASSLKLKVVAEGVETPEQVEALREMCRDRVKIYMQGYYYSKPVPVKQYEAYLSEH